MADDLPGDVLVALRTAWGYQTRPRLFAELTGWSYWILHRLESVSFRADKWLVLEFPRYRFDELVEAHRPRIQEGDCWYQRFENAFRAQARRLIHGLGWPDESSHEGRFARLGPDDLRQVVREAIASGGERTQMARAAMYSSAADTERRVFDELFFLFRIVEDVLSDDDGRISPDNVDTRGGKLAEDQRRALAIATRLARGIHEQIVEEFEH